MIEILRTLPSGALVLDLGSEGGSFPDSASKALAIRADLWLPPHKPERFVQADAASLPFRSRVFDAIILHHSLEHVEQLKPCLQELGRVVKAGGAAFIAVPDATTLTDRVYRRVFRDFGGHVNLFDSPETLVAMLSRYLDLPLVATRPLLSSWAFLNRRNIVAAGCRDEMRFGGLPEPVIAAITAATRLLDRWFGTRTGFYGWAFFFGAIPIPVDTAVLFNVCVRCGQAHPPGRLSEDIRRVGFLTLYKCPGCGARNVLTPS